MKKTLKSTLSVFMAALMILSSIAIVFAAITEITPSGSITFYVPEGVYLTPSDNGSTTNTAAQYYMNNSNANGAYTQSATETTGRIYFNSANATSVSITYSFGTTGTVSGTLSSSSGTLNSTISISAGNTNQLLTWTATYKCRDGATRVATAHTYIYVPNKYPTGVGYDVKSDGKSGDCYVGGLQVLWGANLSGTGSYGVYDAAKLNGSGLTSADNQQPTNSGHISTNYSPKYTNYAHATAESTDSGNPTSETAPVAYYYVDSSRFSNTNQVPNFRYGLTMTDDENTVNTGLILKLENSTGTSVYATYVNQNPASDVNDTNCIADTEKVIYSFSGSGTVKGALSPSITMSSITTNGAASYRFHAFLHGNGKKRHGDCYVNVYSPFTVYNVNKATLRDYYYKTCIANSYQNQQEKFTSSTWSTYVTRLTSAGTVLGNPAASSAEVTNAYNNLKTAYEALVVEKHTASARYVALNHQGTIGYAVKALATSKATSESITYTGASNVKFENSFDGYKIYGYKANQSDVVGTTSYSSGLSGFTTLSSNSLTLYRADGNKAYTFYYIPYDYTISLNANGATQGGDASIVLSYGDNFYKDTKYINKMSVDMNNVTVPSRTGYIFDGFYDANTGGTQMIDKNGYLTANASVTAYTSDTMWYAHWIPISYTINYIGNGATSGTMAPSVHEYGTAKGLSTNEYKRTGYTFSGWSTSSTGSVVYPNGRGVLNLTVIDGDEIDLYAVWTVNQYTIVYVGNGSTGGSTASTVCTYGQPFKIASNGFEKTGYVFKGWATEADGAVVYSAGQKIEESLTEEAGKVIYLYAVWQPTQHLIKFVNHDGDVLQSSLTAYDSMPVYGGATPTKPSTTEEDFTFAGWSPEVSTVTGAQTYTAQFTSSARKYTIKFLDEDGTVLQSSEVPYGTVPAFEGTTPEKAATAQYTYTFAGWDTTPAAVTGNKNYKATYSKVTNQYEIKFVNFDGTELYKVTLDYGSRVVYKGETPTRESDEQYDYTFKNWDKTVLNVKADTVYTAQFYNTLRKYNITFKNHDGTTLAVYSTEYGTTPSYDKGTPTKPETTESVYTFAGWDKTVAPCTGEEVYTATFTESARPYKITFVNYDGTVVYSDEFDYGSTPSCPVTPTKASTVDKEYTFAGWGEITAVDGEKTYTATYTESTRKYNITFLDGDLKSIQSTYFYYGDTPVYSGAKPTKEATAQYTFTFNDKWDKELAAVTGDAVYTAQFDAELNSYEIKFLNYDGTLLETKSVDYGVTPSYDNAEPEKPNDETYSYVFKGWSPELTAVTGNAEYTAQYEQIKLSYIISFVNEDGTLIKKVRVFAGEKPVYDGDEPTKASTAEFDYTFAGWDKEFAEADEATTYTATYNAIRRSYDIKFLNYDGTLLKTQSVEYGTVPVYDGETPIKGGTVQYGYVFTGWTVDPVKVTGEASYTAKFEEVINEYKIKFVNFDGTVLQESDVKYGDTPAYNGETPVRAATAQYTYAFAGWTPEIDTVKGIATYTAKYTSTVNSYTVKFVNYDGTELYSKILDYGSYPTYGGKVPTRAADDDYVYTFSGWDKSFARITADTTFTAKYSTIANSFTVKFVDENGNTIQSKNYKLGEMPVFDGTPTKDCTDKVHYTFTGWDKEITAVTGFTAYKAVFAEEEHTLAYSETKEPTCTEGGKTVYVCPDCGYMTVVETSAAGHKLGETVIDGNRAYKECSVCGEQVEVDLEEAQYQNNLCKYCGKYHYKYIRPDFGWLSCFISRLFDLFAEIAKKLA
jgi:uncharacterized repeat protein (TIGR02543 family)